MLNSFKTYLTHINENEIGKIFYMQKFACCHSAKRRKLKNDYNCQVSKSLMFILGNQLSCKYLFLSFFYVPRFAHDKEEENQLAHLWIVRVAERSHVNDLIVS